MKTELVPIHELNPGDKVFVEWPKDQEKPKWHKLPEVLTVKEVDLHKSQVSIKESGGLCLEAKELHRVLGEPTPEPGDEITFMLETFETGFNVPKEHSAKVIRVSRDPMKKMEPKCIVEVKEEEYGIRLSDIIKLQKKFQEQQISMF